MWLIDRHVSLISLPELSAPTLYYIVLVLILVIKYDKCRVKVDGVEIKKWKMHFLKPCGRRGRHRTI